VISHFCSSKSGFDWIDGCGRPLKVFLVRVRGFVFIPAILILALSNWAVAQAGGASLHGVVIVPSGAPIPQATVSVEGAAGSQAATTNERGQYTLNGLTAGDYKLRVTAPGFDPFEVQVLVQSGSGQEVDAVLRETPKPAQVAPVVAETPAAAAEHGEAAAAQAGETPAQAPPAASA
jgi:hypothetical protein